MALDIQPLDIQPIEDKLDIQPLDIQPLEPAGAPREGASVIPGTPQEFINRPMYQDTSGLGDKALGALEAAGTFFSGAVAPWVAGAKALAGGIPSVDSLPATTEQAGREFMKSIEEATYAPRTEKGQEYAKEVGEAVERYLVPLSGLTGMAGGASRRPSAKAPTKEVPVSKVDAVMEQARAEKAAKTTPLDIQGLSALEGEGGQMALFDMEPGAVATKRSPYAAPEAGQPVWRIDENGMPIRADLSMEAANLRQPLQRNLFGDELGPALEQRRSLTEAIDSMPPGPERAAALARLQTEIEGLPWREVEYEANPAARYETGPLLKMVEELPANRYTPGEGMAKRGAVPVAAESAAGLDAVKRIPGLEDPMRNFRPERLSNEDFIVANKNAPDIDQNALQKMMNYTSKGGHYVAIRTDNPLIKRVTERFRMADDQTKTAIRDVVHSDRGGLAPTVRDLSKQELIETAQLLRQASREQTEVTAQMMKNAGLSDRAILAVEAQQKMVKEMWPKIQQAIEVAGIKNVDQRTAYAASNAAGDFRRVVWKDIDGERKPIGVLSGNSRRSVEKQVAAYKAKDPSAIIGPEAYFGGGRGKHGMSEGFQQMLAFLSEQDPAIRDFINRVDEVMQQDATKYLNAKRHTKHRSKEGVFGLQGDKPFESAYQNAKDFWNSQVRYAENVIRWAEMSKAVEDAKTVMSGLDQPNAKAYLKDYIDSAMGYNPTKFGKKLDETFGTLGDVTGMGTSRGREVMSALRSVTNAKLLGLSPMFLMANIIQPLKVLPEMKAFLKSKGLQNLDMDLGTGYSYFFKGMMDMTKEKLGSKLDPVLKDALDYADRNHVYSSDLFESSNRIRKDLAHYGNKVTQAGATQIEFTTRKGIYLSFVRMLEDSGWKKGDGMFETAHNLTNMAMNNYTRAEAPLMYNIAGSPGNLAYNLMSYKHNELSRMAMFIEEAKDGNMKPLLANLASQVAFGGLMGTILYTEADWIVRKISEALGKPTSLTRELLEDRNNLSDFFKFGMGSVAGVDMTSRLGLGSILPDNLLTAVMPGLQNVIDAGVSVAEAVGSPSEYNVKKAVRDTLPIGLSGIADRMMFTKETPQGEELAINPRTARATVKRTEEDKFWKTIGGTGLSEATQKKQNFENNRIDKFYGDKRKQAMKDLAEAMFTNNKGDQDRAVARFLKYQGDPSNFDRALEEMVKQQNIDEKTRSVLESAKPNISKAHRLMRLVGKE